MTAFPLTGKKVAHVTGGMRPQQRAVPLKGRCIGYGFTADISAFNEHEKAKEVTDLEKTFPELIEKAKSAGSAEELAALAKENGMEITAQEAQMYYEQFHQTTGELLDEELDNVSGGGCHKKDGRLVVTTMYECRHFCCKKCGFADPSDTVMKYGHYCNGGSAAFACECADCTYMSYENGMWLCNHEANRA